MKAVRLASGVAAVTVLCIALLLIVAPGSLLRPAANFLLSDYGIEVLAIQGLQLGWRHGSAAQVRLQLPGVSLTLQDLTVEHRVVELVGAGRIRSVAVQRADLVLAEAAQPGSADPTQLPPVAAVLESVESFPVRG